MFAAIKAGTVDIVTAGIDRFTADGIRLESGAELKADIIVTATGLVLKMLGGMTLTVDGAPVDVAERFSYKGMMLSDVPNLAVSFGYTNASWTLKCDLTSRYVCRLIDHMDRHGLAVCVPQLPAGGMERQPMLDFSSGYVKRAEGSLPHQGPAAPWRVHQHYLRDLKAMRFQPLDDGVMQFL
jgi:cation diffusion facilitator CzcD-associated flavoprotein CzcO